MTPLPWALDGPAMERRLECYTRHMPQTVLVVDDEPQLVKVVRGYLERAGFRVVTAADGPGALAQYRHEKPDLVLLDLNLPGLDGLDVARRLRAGSNVPLIMVTARVEEADRLIGLELGADDYISKPFSPREMVARVKAVLRRAHPEPEPGEPQEKLTLGPIEIDLPRRLVRAGARAVELTPKEFDLLAFLVRNRGIVFSRERLLERVWGYERAVDTRTIDSHVRTLRAKLGGDVDVVKTIRGVGYKAEA